MTSEFFNSYFVFILSTLQGLAICILCSLLLVAIIFSNSLLKRKEMLIIAGQAASELLFGLSSVFFGGYRIALIDNNLDNQLTTAWSCVTFPPVPMTYISQQLVSAMNFFVSVDRLLAVLRPAMYRQLGSGYALKILASASLYSMVSLVTLLLSTKLGVSNSSNYTRTCSGASAPLFPQWYALFHVTFIAVVSLLSVILYIGVFVAYQSAMRNAANSRSITQAVETQQQANQRRLTITIGIITSSSVVLFIAPMTLNAVTIWLKIPTPGRTAITPMLQASAILNTVIYIARQSEIRAAIWKVLKCRMKGPAGDMVEGNNPTRTAPSTRITSQRAWTNIPTVKALSLRGD